MIQLIDKICTLYFKNEQIQIVFSFCFQGNYGFCRFLRDGYKTAREVRILLLSTQRERFVDLLIVGLCRMLG